MKDVLWDLIVRNRPCWIISWKVGCVQVKLISSLDVYNIVVFYLRNNNNKSEPDLQFLPFGVHITPTSSPW